ncbi:hypothetical protein WCE37_03740 [Luteimonas sp. MJ250]|uniref:hypothetical protein n=1 Tax=Luteimonas sp. MJ250 TaxID=3129236 RepID=UPI0031BA0931
MSPDDRIYDGGTLPEIVITGEAPGGLSWSRFRALSAEAGGWLWGTVQGAFNEKASFSQIIVDAVIGMIPIVGDVTAVRDIIAVSVRLVDDPEAREDTWEWVLLVVLVVALIPVVGGVVKGVGRILIKVVKAASGLSGAARAAHLAEGAREITAFLNRIGLGNAERWLLQLKFADHQADIIGHFNALMNTMSMALRQIKDRMGRMMPIGLGRRIDALRQGIAELQAMGSRMIPRAVKELDQQLRELQAFVRSGGETTSRQSLHRVATGERAVTRADEARLIENGALPVRSSRGGFQGLEAVEGMPETWGGYRPESGYPDLAAYSDNGTLPDIAAYSGRIVNRELKDGEKIYRLFGPGGATHGVDVGGSNPGGAWWGLGEPPRTAKKWREQAAVLDEWNRDGYILIGTVRGNGPKTAVGAIAEQGGTQLPGQYLPGGGTQANFRFDRASSAQLQTLANDVIASGRPATWTDPVSGIAFEIRPTGWTDANGVWGYLHPPSAGTVQTARLGAREQASKEHHEVVITP